MTLGAEYMKTKQLRITPFSPLHQQKTRRLILGDLGEHWGWIDEQINTDLVDIKASYASGDFVLGWLGETLVATGALIPEDGHSRRIVRMSVFKQFRRQGCQGSHRLLLLGTNATVIGLCKEEPSEILGCGNRAPELIA